MTVTFASAVVPLDEQIRITVHHKAGWVGGPGLPPHAIVLSLQPKDPIEPVNDAYGGLDPLTRWPAFQTPTTRAGSARSAMSASGSPSTMMKSASNPSAS
jgi:hypothetical protein